MKVAFLVLATSVLTLSACSSAQKARQAEREKVAASTGFFCDFVNGDEFKDAEVALNLSMAKRCDPTKPFSMTGYKNASEIHGIVFCCSTVKKDARVSGPAVAPSKDEKAGDKSVNRGGESSPN